MLGVTFVGQWFGQLREQRAGFLFTSMRHLKPNDAHRNIEPGSYRPPAKKILQSVIAGNIGYPRAVENRSGNCDQALAPGFEHCHEVAGRLRLRRPFLHQRGIAIATSIKTRSIFVTAYWAEHWL
jgi:hypothetical protein